MIHYCSGDMCKLYVRKKCETTKDALFDCPPCLPKEDECYVPMDSLEISLFEEIDACYTYDHDSPIKHHPKHNQTKKKQKVEIKYGCL